MRRKNKLGPRASIRQLVNYEDLDWFSSLHKWALAGRHYRREIYITPEGSLVAFRLSQDGLIKSIELVTNNG